MTPAATARTLAAFVDVLLPGDDLFPSASMTGVQGLLADRIRERLGSGGVEEVVTILSASGPFGDITSDARIAIVSRLEQEQSALFAFLRAATVFAYYQSPAVIAAIRALGHDYNDAPQPDGYPMPLFDFSPGVNVPMNPRGSHKWTDWIEPVDISGLADLNLPVQEG